MFFSKAQKRFAAVFTAAVMLASILGTAAVSAAAAPKLSKKSVTIKKGRTVIVRVKNAGRKVRWSSSNKKIAAVVKIKGTRKGIATIKGKKKGKCVIRAKIGKKILKCRVTVKAAGGTAWPPKEESEWDRKIETRKLSGQSVDRAASYPKLENAGTSFGETESRAMAGFAVDLFRKTYEAEQAEGGDKRPNVLISPDSVITALTMTANGANGDTLSQMTGTLAPGLTQEQLNGSVAKLHDRLTGQKNFIYSVANSIWAKKGTLDVKPAFLQINKNYHNAAFYEADFDLNTVNDMNNWAYNNTRNMIDKIIEGPFSDDARMVLMNAVAFESKWAEIYGPGQRVPNKPFTTAAGAVQSVNMLYGRENDYLEVAGGKAFAKYYRGGKVAFVGMLPPEGKSLAAYVAGMTGADFMDAWKNRQQIPVNVCFPEFKYDYGVSMKDTLQAMGMTLPFTDDADFFGISDPTPETPYGLKISDVLHKTHIELDRKGTKAAAVTAVVMEKAGAMPGEIKEVYLDRAFVYALVDTETGMPLFLGTVGSVE